MELVIFSLIIFWSMLPFPVDASDGGSSECRSAEIVEPTQNDGQIVEIEYSEAEANTYCEIGNDPELAGIAPKYHWARVREDGKKVNRLQNLFSGFDPDKTSTMDIKLGKRTFSQREMEDDERIGELYAKLVELFGRRILARLTPIELIQKAVSGWRYAQIRDLQSLSSTLGFRLQGQWELSRVEQIREILNESFGTKMRPILLSRLRQIRDAVQRSEFFRKHEIVDSAVRIVQDSNRLGAWLIGFGKALPLPEGVELDHRKEWDRENHEDGYLSGLDALVQLLQEEEERQKGAELCRKWHPEGGGRNNSALRSWTRKMFNLAGSTAIRRAALIALICATVGGEQELLMKGQTVTDWRKDPVQIVDWHGGLRLRYFAHKWFAEMIGTWNSSVLELLESLVAGNLLQTVGNEAVAQTADAKFTLAEIKNGKSDNSVKKEIDFFDRHFAAYFRRIMDKRGREQSLLPHFFALFSIGQNADESPKREQLFLVTKNALPAGHFHYEFDLKGDMHESNFVGLFREGIVLDGAEYARFCANLEQDAMFLHGNHLTDYALSIGVHFGQLDADQMEALKIKYQNVLEGSCTNCSLDGGRTFFERIEHIVLVAGLGDIFTQFYLSRERNANIQKNGGEKYFAHFMCFISTRVFLPDDQTSTLEEYKAKYCDVDEMAAFNESVEMRRRNEGPKPNVVQKTNSGTNGKTTAVKYVGSDEFDQFEDIPLD